MVSAELICKVLCKLDLLVIDDIELQVIIAAPSLSVTAYII